MRPPNVATALADVLAGFAVAGREHPATLLWLLAASACLYAGGVVLNDVFDRQADAIERPERPLPSGRVRVSHAAWLGGGLLAAGSTCAFADGAAAGVVAVVLVTAILLYDAVAKPHLILGPATMGACRGLNFLLGLSAAPAALAVSWPLSLIAVVYVASVTAISRGEVAGGNRRTAAVSAGGVAGVVLVLAILTARTRPSLAAFALLAALAWRVVPPFRAAWRRPDPALIRLAVKRGVLSLVLVDAVLATVYAGIGYGALVLATGVLAAYLARSFAVT